jgi:hypothetical protein
MSGVMDERREWHTCSGYSKRSMVENTVYRYKTIIGRSMRSRTFAGQRVEAQLASKILNTMTCFGMPDSYRVVSRCDGRQIRPTKTIGVHADSYTT